ncbi:LETM1-like protein [Marivirga sericea]|uniref:LETM1-like protein n=1 Tax=Marivirga sericea TaxID=1028 RepID=A0A1X7KR53_9BACT|nr:LETM1 domain-containing protein [Marivirga sericea]SMG43772.1 LETM1-like protein [Marivirga sericea]
MNPAEKGWLKEYIKFRSPYPIDLNQYQIQDQDNLLYKLIQPTGLIYGHPIHAPGLRHPKEQRWNSLGKMKIVLLESFIHSARLKQVSLPQRESDWKDYYLETSQSIGRFYSILDPSINKKKLLFFNRPRVEDVRFTEQVLHRRLFLKSRWDNYWASLFQNSLLFLDTYYFGEWRAGNFHNIKWHKDAMKILLLKVIAAAAHANQIIAREERNMFFNFLSSANLSKAQSKLAKEAFKDGVTLDQIDLRQADTWLLKKYVLELAILMIWADKVISIEERAFLTELAQRLGISEEELDISLIAIESFVIENWKEVYFLQNKHSFQVISETILQRIASVLKKNRVSIGQEIRESSELWHLLEKFKAQPLSDEEKELVRVKLIDILNSIPAFVIIELPASFLTLPVLLKLLPKSILPVDFQD